MTPVESFFVGVLSGVCLVGLVILFFWWLFAGVIREADAALRADMEN